MPRLPRDKNFDSTLSLLSEGYRFISTRCERYGTDVFETRLVLRKAVCARGEEAARMFYQPDRFTRKGALPPTALKLLQDIGSVQWQDGEAHRRRKQMFMSLMTEPNIRQLVDMTVLRWRDRLADWEEMQEIVLHDEVREILCDAVCAWAGVPLSAREVRQRTREFAAMIDGAGSVGPWNWRGMLLRSRTERWARSIVTAIRNHRLGVAEGSAVNTIAWHYDSAGGLLKTKTAAVELLNVLRPIVAVARFIVFAALALHEHPECRQKLQSGDDRYLEWFVQEVRRFYPFFPVVGGRVRNGFEWREHRFDKGDWVLLDLYGTNHDSRAWKEPGTFRPERFESWNSNPFNFIPQGGGDHYRTHRCPGEWVTVELIKAAVILLTSISYDVPVQDLRVNLGKMPALPVSGFRIGNVRPA